MRRKFVAAVALGASVLMTVSTAHAVFAGTFRLNFGTSGFLIDTLAADAQSSADAVVVQPNGRIVVGTGTDGLDEHWALERYDSYGTLDPSFGTGGIAADPPIADLSKVLQVALQGNNILVLGVDQNYTPYVARYTAAGLLDTSFAGIGYVAVDLVPGHTLLQDMAVDADGRIVLAGLATGSAHGQMVERLQPDGAVDAVFGTGGFAIVNTAGTDAMAANAVTTEADGRILTTGYSYSGGYALMSLVALTDSGAVDTSFGGGDGVVLQDIGTQNDVGEDIVVQTDGSILVAGSATWANIDVVVARFLPDGTLDTGYGESGHRAINSGDVDEAYAIALQPDGRAVITGSLSVGSTSYLMIARLLTNGDLDTSFAPAGYRAVDLGQVAAGAKSLALARNGDAVLGGVVLESDGTSHPVLVRFIADGTPPSAATVTTPGRFALTLTPWIRWTASDDNSGVSTYTVDQVSASFQDTEYGPPTRFEDATHASSAPFDGTPGRTYCFTASARDRSGNSGPVGEPSCVALPVDDRSLTEHGTWSDVSAPLDYLGTARRSSEGGAYLSATVAYRHLILIATTCPTCGSVRVFVGGTLHRSLDLYAPTVHRQMRFLIDASETVRTGVVKVVQNSAGEHVDVDGLGVSLS